MCGLEVSLLFIDNLSLTVGANSRTGSRMSLHYYRKAVGAIDGMDRLSTVS